MSEQQGCTIVESLACDDPDCECRRDAIDPVVTIPRAQHEALMAGAFWLLKLRSLGYVSAGHGRKMVDEILSVIRAVGIEIKADSERDERLRAIGRRAAGIETEG